MFIMAYNPRRPDRIPAGSWTGGPSARVHGPGVVGALHWGVVIFSGSVQDVPGLGQALLQPVPLGFLSQRLYLQG